MHGVLRSAGYSLMSMFVSCGVGAQDVSASIKVSFTGTPEEAWAIHERVGQTCQFAARCTPCEAGVLSEKTGRDSGACQSVIASRLAPTLDV